MNILQPVVTFVLCYLIGSFPTAYLAGRLNKINIFEIGSGNMGANNVTRALGIKWGAVVWAGDVFKGMLAVAIARLIMASDIIAASVVGSVMVVIGHNWSVLAAMITGKLRGGKGAATAGGTWIMMAPWQVVVITIGLWGLIVLVTRYVSLAVLVAIAIGTAWMMLLIAQQTPINQNAISPTYSFYILLVAVMIYIRHWENIQRLLAGRERRIGEKAQSSK